LKWARRDDAVLYQLSGFPSAPPLRNYHQYSPLYLLFSAIEVSSRKFPPCSLDDAPTAHSSSPSESRAHLLLLPSPPTPAHASPASSPHDTNPAIEFLSLSSFSSSIFLPANFAFPPSIVTFREEGQTRRGRLAPKVVGTSRPKEEKRADVVLGSSEVGVADVFSGVKGVGRGERCRCWRKAGGARRFRAQPRFGYALGTRARIIGNIFARRVVEGSFKCVVVKVSRCLCKN